MTEALAVIEEIDELLEETEHLHHKATDFFEGVETKCAGIEASIRSAQRATVGQLQALINMRDAVARWKH